MFGGYFVKVVKRIFGLVLVLALVVSLFGCTYTPSSSKGNGDGGFTMTSFPPVSTYTPKPQETQPSGNDNREPVTQTERPNVEPTAEPTVAPSKAAYEITFQKSYIYTNSINDICLYVMIEVENIGSVDLRLADAKFELEDRDGKLLATCDTFSTDTVPQIIAPGEKGYIYNAGYGLKGDVNESTDYVLVPVLDIKQSKNPIVRLDLSDIDMTPSSNMFYDFEIVGRATNNTNEEQSLTTAYAVIFNKAGEPVLIDSGHVDKLAPGARTSFSISGDLPDGMSYDDIGNYKVFASPYQFQFDW